MSVEDKVDQIMGDVREMKTLLAKVVEPAVNQVWESEKTIAKLYGFQKVIKYVGGTTVFITSAIVVKAIYTFIIKHPPPPSIHP